MGRRVPPQILQAQNEDDFRGIFRGNVATETGDNLALIQYPLLHLGNWLQPLLCPYAVIASTTLMDAAAYRC